MQKVVLVDRNDKEIGSEEKMKAHREGKLHRAFSVFVFNSKGQVLLQKRAKTKYHTAGLWSNTCCSHPKPGEDTEKAAHRRLKEEMGFDCGLKKIFSFVYRVKLGGLFEHEYDHVFTGKFGGNPAPNEEEVEGWKWMDMDEIKNDMKQNPENYTYWFRISLEKVASFTGT